MSAAKPNQQQRWAAEAHQLGVQAAQDRATWITDGNETDESRRAKLQLIEDGEFADNYWLSAPNLSGEFADELTPRSLFESITGLDAHAESSWNVDAYNAVVDELADAFEAGVSETFEDACAAELTRWLS